MTKEEYIPSERESNLSWKYLDFSDRGYNLFSPGGILWNLESALAVNLDSVLYLEAKEAEKILKEKRSLSQNL